MYRPWNLTKKLYTFALKPQSKEADSRRQEFILNVLLTGLIGITIIALSESLYAWSRQLNVSGPFAIFVMVCLLAILLTCWRLARLGHIRVASYIFTTVLLVLATGLMLRWSFELPQVLLDYSMIIMIAGILLGARSGLGFTGLAVLCVVCVAFAQTTGHVHHDIAWRHKPPVFMDAIGFALVLGIMGIVSWLSTREIDRSLQRARVSEAALLRERDSLEMRVVERTRELKESQLMRTIELERFAAFGKISASFVHDMSNPLMAATLNLQHLKTKDTSQLARISKDLVQIERHMEAARQQLRGSSSPELFSVAHELQQISRLARPIARHHAVHMHFPKAVRIRLYGDPVKFNQIVSNLLVNAIESYASDSPLDKREVTLDIRQLMKGIKLTVKDRGNGIAANDLQHIFESFYSKKPEGTPYAGMGIGLCIVKQFVEQDFDGTISVSSTPGVGTRFSVTLYSAKETTRDKS